MNCPFCKEILEDFRCNKCSRDKSKILLRLSEIEEEKGEFDKALEYLNILKSEDLDKEIGNEVEKRKKLIYLLKFDGEHQIEQDEGDSSDKKKGRSLTKKISLIAALIIIILISVYMPSILRYLSNTDFIFAKNTSKRVDTKLINDRQLNTMLIINISQGYYPYVDIADRFGYNRLIKFLRENRDIRINLAISSIALKTIMWYDNETINLIKDGIADGQFEMIGSLSARSVVTAIVEEDVKKQILDERESFKNILGIEPKCFMFPEELVSKEIMEKLPEYGYESVIVENSIVEKNGGTKDSIYQFGDKLKVITYSNKLGELFQAAVDAGDSDKDFYKSLKGANLAKNRIEYYNFYKNLRDIYKKNNLLAGCFIEGDGIGADDAIERNNPEWDIKNMKILFEGLREMKWINTVKTSNLRNSNGEVRKITFNNTYVKTMDKAATDENPNIKDWKSYNSISKKMEYYRNIFQKNRKELEKYKDTKNIILEKLLKYADNIIIAHQYRFGLIGFGGNEEDIIYDRKYTIYEGAKNAGIILEAMTKVESGINEIYEKDINDDKEKELIAVNEGNFYVFSKIRGGRILFWYDFKTGTEYIGNLISELYIDKVAYDINQPVFGFDARPFKIEYERYYNGNIKSGPLYFEFSRFIVDERSTKDYFYEKKYYARQGALNETLQQDVSGLEEEAYKDDKIYVYNNESEVTCGNGEIDFKEYGLNKKIIFNKNGFLVKYNINEKILNTEITFDIGLDSGELFIKNGDRSILEANKIKNGMEIRNSETGKKVRITGSDNSTFELVDSLFGKIVSVKDSRNEFELKVEK